MTAAKCLVLVAIILLFMLSLSPARAAPPEPTSAVYLSLGDGIQYGCCVAAASSGNALFSRFLAARLHRPVDWIALANSDPTIPLVTADSFVNGYQGHESQLARAVAALGEFRRSGRPVVAITLSVGGNDLVEVGNNCRTPPCADLYYRVMARMTPQLDMVYQAISAAKDPATPLLVLTYYNASDCGQPGVDTSPTELGVRGWNAAIQDAITRNGAFLVDGYTDFRGRACELVRNLDLTPAGHQLLSIEYEKTYRTLPAPYIDPFDRTPRLNRWALSSFMVAIAALLLVLAYFTTRSRRRTS